MAVSVGNMINKVLMITVNFLLAVVGALVCSFSFWTRYDNSLQQEIQTIVDNNSLELNLKEYGDILVLMGVLGLVLFFVGFLGCAGACCENLCVVTLHFMVVFVIFLAEFSSVIAALVNQDKLIAEMKQLVTEQDKTTIAGLESSLHCCGIDGINCDSTIGFKNNGTDCPTAVIDVITKNMNIAWAIAAVSLSIELFCLIWACFVCRGIRKGMHIEPLMIEKNAKRSHQNED